MAEASKYKKGRQKVSAACDIAEGFISSIEYLNEDIKANEITIAEEKEKPETEQRGWLIESCEMNTIEFQAKIEVYEHLLRVIDKEWMPF